jgi:manganese-dependent inorganic pyrophosphatase
VETKIPVTATFDPVGSTATLVIERFRQNGMEPSPPTATMLLGAILSDTVILNSPTVTERDRTAVEYLERVLEVDALEFGREMFESTSDVSGLPAEEIVSRDAKEYQSAGGQTMCIAQVETVGRSLLGRKDELLAVMGTERERQGYAFFALMVTDILSKGTDLLVSGDKGTVERALGQTATDGVIELPGVISRKKQVAPQLLAAG